MQSKAITDKNGDFFDSIGQERRFNRVAEKSVHTPTTDVMTSGRKRREVPESDIRSRSFSGEEAASSGGLH